MTIKMKNPKTRYGLSLLALGYMGGTIYCLIYLRYIFYDQMLMAMQCTNQQLGFLNTTNASASLICGIFGAYLADKWDAKNIIIVAGGGVSILTYIYGMFCNSYTVAVAVWFLLAIVMAPYWAALIKYINGLGGEEKAGNAFGTYYLINGLAGALGNAIPLWVSRFAGFRAALFTLGTITLGATIMIALFLDSEKDKIARGEKMVGDEPIRLKYVVSVLKWPGTYILFFAIFGVFSLYTNVSYFNPYLINVIGVDPDASSAISLVRSYGCMLVAPVGGFLADRVFKSTSKWFICGSVIAAALFAITFAITPEANVTLVCIYSVIPSLVTYALYGVMYSVVRELHIPATVTGTAVGLASLAINVANIIEPTLFGGWLDKLGVDGYANIFLFLIGMCVFTVIISLCSMSHNKKCREGRRVFQLKEEAA